MGKASRSNLLSRVARLEAASTTTSTRPTGVVRVRLKDGQAFAEDVAINRRANVMIAPEASGLDEWEAMAVASQRRLKAEVRK